MKNTMKKLLPILLVLAVVFAAGCSIDLGAESIMLPRELYSSDNGYEMMVPSEWTEEKIAEEQVVFSAEDKQIAMSITTELGGVDYYSMRELKEQLAEEIGTAMFKSYQIVEENNGTKYFRVLLQGTDNNGAKITVDIFASQPYVTMRHYVVTVCASEIYASYSNMLDGMFESFTATMTEDEYLQLMTDRRTAAAEAERNAANDGEPGADDAANEGTDSTLDTPE